MANTYVAYEATGGDDTYTVPFPFLDRLHVIVSVDGEPVASDEVDWLTDGSLKLVTPAAAGAAVEIRRSTPTSALTGYGAGNTVTKVDLQTDSLQALYCLEEVRDNHPSLDDLPGAIADIVTDEYLQGIAEAAVDVYSPGYEGAKPSYSVRQNLKDRAILLTEFADPDGGEDISQGIKDWLQVASDEKRVAYAPSGVWSVNALELTGVEYLDVSAHPGAIFRGLKSWQRFAGSGAIGQTFTVTDFTLSAGGTLAAMQITAAGLHVALTPGVDFTQSGYTLTLIGSVTIPEGDVLHVASTETMLAFRAPGSDTTRAGFFRWEGGQFDAGERGAIDSQASGSALSLHYYKQYVVHGTGFIGADDYLDAADRGVSDSGLTALMCNSGSVSDCLFQGWGDLGIYNTGGGSADSTDDAIGLAMHGNHFVKCVTGWKSARQARNTNASGNTYDRCWIGAALWPASDINAGRGSITGETFLRCGRNAIDVRQQVGCVVGDNTVIDFGYLLDGVTPADQYAGGGAIAAIVLSGCYGTKVTDNVVRTDELEPLANSYGIRNLSYTFGGTTYEPTDNTIHDNDLEGVNIGIQQNGSGTGNRYRSNEFRNVTTHYDGIPNESLGSGEYTPTITNQTNVAASVARTARWYRHDDMIVVDGTVEIDPTDPSVYTEIRLSLPFTHAFGNEWEASGIGSSAPGGAGAANIYALIPGSGVRMTFLNAADVASRVWAYHYSFKVN